jgi:predicted methyltransferase
MSPEAKGWLDRNVGRFLETAGVRPGQTVLDFGCNEGNYAAPAAKIVGPSGTVYALDKDGDALKDVRRTVRKRGIRNAKCLRIKKDQGIPLSPCSVDVVLLYDVLHRGYFPKADERRAVLAKVYAVLKSGGLLSLYPTHLKSYGMTFGRVLSEVKAAGFRLRHEARRRLVHDGSLVRGRVFTFSKKGGCGGK